MPGAVRLRAQRCIQLPAVTCPDGDALTLDGAMPRTVNITGATSLVRISAEGGDVYYAINGANATPQSPGYVPEDGSREIGPIANFSSLSLFGSAADTQAHLTFCREEGTEGGVVWHPYAEKVLGYGPIAYWPLWEESGAFAQCLVNPAQNGAYTGVTLANGTAPDGSPCPFFDGANDFVDIHSATLAGAFDGDEGTFAAWARVFNAGVWTDGNERRINNLEVDGANRIIVRKDVGNDSSSLFHFAGGANESITNTPYSNTAWFHIALTWSLSADETKAYFDGLQVGATQAGLAAWVGALAAGMTLLGSDFPAPVKEWHGWLAHCAIWDLALTQPQLADLATV